MAETPTFVPAKTFAVAVGGDDARELPRVASVRTVVSVHADDVAFFEPPGSDGEMDDVDGAVPLSAAVAASSAASAKPPCCACLCRNQLLSVDLAMRHAENMVVHAVLPTDNEVCGQVGSCGGRCRQVAPLGEDDLGVFECPVCVSPKAVAEHVSVGLGAFFFDLRFAGFLLALLALLSLPICIFNAVRTTQIVTRAAEDSVAAGDNSTVLGRLHSVSPLGYTTAFPIIYLRSDIEAVYSWQTVGVQAETAEHVVTGITASVWPLWVVLLQTLSALVAFTGVMWLRVSSHTRITNLQNRKPDPLHYTLVASDLPPCTTAELVQFFGQYGVVARITAVSFVGATLIELRNVRCSRARVCVGGREKSCDATRRTPHPHAPLRARCQSVSAAPRCRESRQLPDATPPCLTRYLYFAPRSPAPQEAARLEKHVKQVSAREDRNEAALVRLQQKLGALRVKASTVEIRSKAKHEERKVKTGRMVHTVFVTYEDSVDAKQVRSFFFLFFFFLRSPFFRRREAGASRLPAVDAPRGRWPGAVHRDVRLLLVRCVHRAVRALAPAVLRALRAQQPAV